MEIKKIILTLSVICFGTHVFCQKELYNRAGMLRAQGNLAGGYLFEQQEYAAYVTGDFDLYLTPKISVSGEGWYSFAINDNELGIRKNHSVYGGLTYHPLRNPKWDPYIGFSPGAGFVTVGYDDMGVVRLTNFNIVPLISFTVGCNWYVGSIFHFFFKCRFTSGQVFGELTEPIRLEEMKLTGGLGWNIRCWKPRIAGTPVFSAQH